MELMADYRVGKVPTLDDIPYELYKIMPGLFGHLLASIYTNWKRNGLLPRFVRRGVWTLIRI